MQETIRRLRVIAFWKSERIFIKDLYYYDLLIILLLYHFCCYLFIFYLFDYNSGTQLCIVLYLYRNRVLSHSFYLLLFIGNRVNALLESGNGQKAKKNISGLY